MQNVIIRFYHVNTYEPDCFVFVITLYDVYFFDYHFESRFYFFIFYFVYL